MEATPSVVWQPVAAIALRFAIESASPAVLQRARLLFAPWIVENTDAEIAHRWLIEADSAGEDKWSIAGAREDYYADGATPFSWRERPLVELLTQLEYASLGHLLAHLPADFVGLHGALLSHEFDGARRAVIVVGPKESGKSTLACALWKAGWTLHCDDFTLLDASGHAWPTARRVSLRNGSRPLLGEELSANSQRTPSIRWNFVSPARNRRASARADGLEVGAICLLKRRDVEMAPAQSAPLGGIEAALALLAYSNLLFEAGSVQHSSECADWDAQLAAIATLLESSNIPLYDLGRGEPAAMAREIARLIRIKQ